MKEWARDCLIFDEYSTDVHAPNHVCYKADALGVRLQNEQFVEDPSGPYLLHYDRDDRPIVVRR